LDNGSVKQPAVKKRQRYSYPLAIRTLNLSPLIAPRAMVYSAGGFALIEPGGLAGFGPHPSSVAGRASDGPPAPAPGAFIAGPKLFFRLYSWSVAW